jgi:hypothetical protein
MKFMTLITLSLFTQIALANLSSLASQQKMMENHAKQLRRQLYIDGYSDVHTSKPESMTAQKLNKIYKDNSTFASPLNKAQFSQLYSCLNSHICALWYFEMSSSMYGGSGHSGHFVLLNITNGRLSEIDYSIYEE